MTKHLGFRSRIIQYYNPMLTSTLSTIRIYGADTLPFLQGLLTCDLHNVAETPLLAACCNQKGRILANFLIWRSKETFFLQLPQSMSSLFIEHLKKHPCIDCGEDNVVVLDFDHMRDKRMSVPMLANRPCSLATLREEIEKCEIRCSNCHRIKTAKENGWFKLLNNS